ncbi:MAG: GNAT family N-acetyltransferase [Chitinophagaceae bacterium]|nr:GNAT family N-acetyltransferase [Chitinophagaceae bacterium]MCW5904551.1 GNAT family N-acetyltransferase [Chitinophagaceae bacterium]
MKTPSHILTTERLILRNWIDTDTSAFIAMNKDYEVMKFFPKTLTDSETLELLERIKLHFEKNSFGLFAVESKSTKQFIGFTGFSIPTFNAFFTPCVEIGWRYKKEVWGQGFATEAALACLRYGFETLGFDKIVSFTSSVNKKSEDVMKRIGMKFKANFEHPKIETTNILCKHILYEIHSTVK